MTHMPSDEEARWGRQDNFNNQVSRDIGSILSDVRSVILSQTGLTTQVASNHKDMQTRMDKLIEVVQQNDGHYVKRTEYEDDKLSHNKRLEEVETWKSEVRDKFIKWGAYFGVIGVVFQTLFFYVLLPYLKDIWNFFNK